MDSPESNKIVASSSSLESPVVQESPFFNYLRTLSPIKPVKAAAHLAQGFSELSIPPPPPVFTSPRLNLQSETVFLKRSEYNQSSNAKLCIGYEDRGHTFQADSDVSERPNSRMIAGLVSCTKRESATKCALQVQPSSPSGFVENCLTDPAEVDSVNLSDPGDSCLNQLVDTSEALEGKCITSKETTVKVDDDDDKASEHMEIGVDVQISFAEGSEDLQTNSLAVGETEKRKEGERMFPECPDLISEEINGFSMSDSLKPASGEQNVPHVDTQSVETGQEGSKKISPEVLSETLQAGDHAAIPSYESVESNIADHEEVGQHQRGTRRRCLQFEASVARRNSSANNHEFSNPASVTRCSRLPADSTDLEMLESPQLDLVTPNNNCPGNSAQPVASKSSLCSAKTRENNVEKFDKPAWNGGTSSIRAPLRSGIGLHLNSIVNTGAMGCTRSLSIIPAENDYPSAQRDKSPIVIKRCLPEESKSDTMATNLVEKLSTNNHGDLPESQSVVTEYSSISQFSYDQYQELSQLSPNINRKRAYTMEDEGCKRCNCRRSKCLKLYCECFASGIYCAEPCACQECFNKPEYEDMVLGTRQQIETRNPLAFAPKIVRRVTDSPANSGEDNNKVTPASARHKRGCNCKKSMCLKKYCECFQAGVGCSAGCRCDGCKNAFGAKEGYGEISGIVSRKVNGESWEEFSDGKLVIEKRNKIVCSENHQPHHLTPPTPSFQSSIHRKDVPKSRFPRRDLPSPESGSNILSSTVSPSSSRNLNTHERQTKLGEGNFDLVFDQEMEFSTTGRVDQFSPRWDGFEDICNLTPLRQDPSKASAISSPSSSRDSVKVSRVQLQGSVRLSGSLRWRSSPIPPMPRLGGSKLSQEPDSDIGNDILEDDTPDILKDTHTPIKAVKAISPNQKRVTPPHGHLQSLTTNPSPGLRSGRKFVLQSISSFPPLTPYSDPKDNSSNK